MAPAHIKSKDLKRILYANTQLSPNINISTNETGTKVTCGGGGAPSAVTQTGTNQQFFAIAMTGLGREACVSLASSDWGTDGLISIQVVPDGTAAGNETQTFTAAELPITMIDAGTACGKYGSKSTIVWTYY